MTPLFRDQDIDAFHVFHTADGETLNTRGERELLEVLNERVAPLQAELEKLRAEISKLRAWLEDGNEYELVRQERQKNASLLAALKDAKFFATWVEAAAKRYLIGLGGEVVDRLIDESNRIQLQIQALTEEKTHE